MVENITNDIKDGREDVRDSNKKKRRVLYAIVALIILLLLFLMGTGAIASGNFVRSIVVSIQTIFGFEGEDTSDVDIIGNVGNEVVDPNAVKGDNITDGSVSNVSTDEEDSAQQNRIVMYSKYYVNKNSQEVPLINSEKSYDSAKYTIYDTSGNVLFETGLIEPGSKVNWKAYGSFTTGTYNIKMNIRFFDRISGEEMIPYTLETILIVS